MSTKSFSQQPDNNSQRLKDSFANKPSPIFSLLAKDDPMKCILLSSLASASMTPPTVVFSLSKNSGDTGYMRQIEHFIACQLTAHHTQLATDICTPGQVRKNALSTWLKNSDQWNGVTIKNSPCSLLLDKRQEIEIGDSLVLFCEVSKAETYELDSPPLVSFRRTLVPVIDL